jgi:hypothetical protein
MSTQRYNVTREVDGELRIVSTVDVLDAASWYAERKKEWADDESLDPDAWWAAGVAYPLMDLLETIEDVTADQLNAADWLADLFAAIAEDKSPPSGG